jgi:hypothetical protein
MASARDKTQVAKVGLGKDLSGLWENIQGMGQTVNLAVFSGVFRLCQMNCRSLDWR